jgi:hypothetical protein
MSRGCLVAESPLSSVEVPCQLHLVASTIVLGPAHQGHTKLWHGCSRTHCRRGNLCRSCAEPNASTSHMHRITHTGGTSHIGQLSHWAGRFLPPALSACPGTEPQGP